MYCEKTVLLIAGSVILAGASAVRAQQMPVVKFTKVVFAENFDSYTKDNLLPMGGKWDTNKQKTSEKIGAYIRQDADGVFGSDRKNQYLQILDDDAASSVRIIAGGIGGLNAMLVHLSFDAFKPKALSDGSLSIKMGTGDVSSDGDNLLVNSISIDKKDRIMPAGSGCFSLDSKFRVDVYFNETTNMIVYLAVDGTACSLTPGAVDIWVDGRLKGAGQKLTKGGATYAAAIKSLRVDTFRASRYELWLDNLEISVPQEEALIVG